RVGVDRDRQLDRGGRAERLARLVVQQPRLAAQSHQQFAVRGGTARRAAADEYLTRGGLEGADALTDRAWGDVQPLGGRLEAPVIRDGHERGELTGAEIHQLS